MKTFQKILLLLIFLSAYSYQSYAQDGSFRIRNDAYIQIGYDQYKVLTFGKHNNTPMNGAWSMEHYDNGFNFWRPWPAPNHGNYKLFIKDNNGYVGIGRKPWHKLDVNGNIGTYGTLMVSSDEKLKTNINRLQGNNCLSLVLGLKSYQYNLKYKELPPGEADEGTYISPTKQKTIDAQRQDNSEAQTAIRHGFLAQEVKEIIPEIVETNGEYMSIDYIALIPILTEAVKEQNKVIENLEIIITQLQQEVKTLTKK